MTKLALQSLLDKNSAHLWEEKQIFRDIILQSEMRVQEGTVSEG